MLDRMASPVSVYVCVLGFCFFFSFVSGRSGESVYAMGGGGVTWVELDLRTHFRFLYTVPPSDKAGHMWHWQTNKKTWYSYFYWERWLELKCFEIRTTVWPVWGKLMARPHEHRVTESHKETDVLASVSDDRALCSCTCGRAVSSP